MATMEVEPYICTWEERISGLMLKAIMVYNILILIDIYEDYEGDKELKIRTTIVFHFRILQKDRAKEERCHIFTRIWVQFFEHWKRSQEERKPLFCCWSCQQ